MLEKLILELSESAEENSVIYISSFAKNSLGKYFDDGNFHGYPIVVDINQREDFLIREV